MRPVITNTQSIASVENKSGGLRKAGSTTSSERRTQPSFSEESLVGGVLDKSGAPVTSVQFVRRLLDVSDLPAVQTGTYALGQHLADLECRRPRWARVERR